MSSRLSQPHQLADYSFIKSLPEVWPLAAKRFGDTVALHNPHVEPETIVTYTQLNQQIQQFAAGLQVSGVKPQSKVALFADNSPRWLIADQGIMMAGAVDVVRSSGAEREELLYILSDSDSTSLVIEDVKTLKKLQPQLNNLPIKLIVLLSNEARLKESLVPWPADDAETQSLKILTFSQLMSAGANCALQPVEQNQQSLATLLYTSGTTGKPKGVMLSHGNLLHQITATGAIVQPQKGDRVLSILPSWHSYERSCEYFLLAHGCTQIYTNLRSVKKDFKEYQPHYMVGVPRLWESIYEGIQKQFREQPASRQRLINFFFNSSERYIIAQRIVQGLSLEHLNASAAERVSARASATLLKPLHLLGERIVYRKVREAVGGHLKSLISGGGSLARHLDNFYEIVGIPLQGGYGLTETAPITNARRLNRNLRGSSGQPLPETEIRIADPETRQTLPPGQRGLVLIRGPQVMQGYYKQPEATRQAIDSEGWFNSGDLGWVTPMNDLVLTGRAKDTIVLTNGENIEPQPIEDACVRSPYIDQIMLVGQDQRSLGALIVPNLEALKQWSQEQNLQLRLPEVNSSIEEAKQSDLYSQPMRDLYRQELNREVKNRPGYRQDDRIGPFAFILEPFSIENGLMSQTLKIKRPAVRDRYDALINGMFES